MSPSGSVSWEQNDKATWSGLAASSSEQGPEPPHCPSAARIPDGEPLVADHETAPYRTTHVPGHPDSARDLTFDIGQDRGHAELPDPNLVYARAGSQCSRVAGQHRRAAAGQRDPSTLGQLAATR